MNWKSFIKDTYLSKDQDKDLQRRICSLIYQESGIMPKKKKVRKGYLVHTYQSESSSGCGLPSLYSGSHTVTIRIKDSEYAFNWPDKQLSYLRTMKVRNVKTIEITAP